MSAAERRRGGTIDGTRERTIRHRDWHRWTRGAIATAGAGALCACAGPQSTLDPAGPAAAQVAQTWWLMLGAAAAIWALVLALLLYALLRGQNTRALARPQRLIVGGGLVLPALALAALLVYGTVTSGRVTGLGAEVDAVVEVEARRWQWRFRYLGTDGSLRATSVDELALPRGQMVEFHVSSVDVIHSFWIPRLGGKIDAIPGRVNRLRLRADRAGPMRGQCAEFCGLEHAHMDFAVRVLEPDDWSAWLEARGVAAPAAAEVAAGTGLDGAVGADAAPGTAP
ncbi:cytochrome c oxidase subunit II [Luteimonas sp. RD2P54]|uniref:cytochrome-c oxidase n=1 Tax=Luteimonas endophytica TaxID=3042023 RepID=A0ABT6JD98_9GAMM|nr:cytochrome c oxidase subunit II [Luteimonas endophytica]MDH5824799.1 cytochrome c oxidase subunit II [Luteimonas endophytica]